MIHGERHCGDDYKCDAAPLDVSRANKPDALGELKNHALALPVGRATASVPPAGVESAARTAPFGRDCDRTAAHRDEERITFTICGVEFAPTASDAARASTPCSPELRSQ